MGAQDKMKNKAEDGKGRTKEMAGDATDNPRLKAEGEADRAEAKVRNAGEQVKDAGGDVKDAFKR